MAKAFRVVGIDQAIKKLDEVRDELFERVKQLTETRTKAVENKARSNAPKKSGALRDSIDSEVEAKESWVFGRVAASAPHAHFPEFGTVKRPAKPYLRPAHESEARNYENDVRKVVQGLKSR